MNTKLMLLSILLSAASLLADTNTATLTWDPPADTDIVGYVIRYGTATNALNSATNVGTTLTNAVRGLAAATTYFFTVSAYNSLGIESLPSNMVSGRTPNPPPPPVVTKPAAPTNLRVIRFADTLSTDDSVNLSWTHSTQTPDTRYVLHASTNALGVGNIANAPFKIDVGTNLLASVRDLKSARWSFAVTAARGETQSLPTATLIVEVSPPAKSDTTVIDAGAFRVMLP